MCMIEIVSLWFAAIDIVPFHASNGRVPDRSALLNSPANIRDLICMGSSSNALFVSIHFVSTGTVQWLNVHRLTTHSEVTQVFHSILVHELRALHDTAFLCQ